LRDADVLSLVQVHLESFPNFFLSFMGPRFLALLYREINREPGHICLVAESELGAIIGFVVGVTDQVGLYRRLANRKWLAFAIASSFVAVRHPSVLPRLFRSFKYPEKASGASCPALLMSIAVSPSAKGKGVGQALVHRFLEELSKMGSSRLCLTTDRDRNEATNGFYRKLGFSKVREYATPEGRWMNEYVIRVRDVDVEPLPKSKQATTDRNVLSVNRVNSESSNATNEEFYMSNATTDDALALAGLHIKAAKNQPGAFLPKLGIRFLTQYYELLVEDRNGYVLCAKDKAGRLAGFISGTERAEEHFAQLAAHRFQLLWCLSARAMLSPTVLIGLWRRTGIVSDSIHKNQFVVSSGFRIEYWAWDPDRTDTSSSVLLLLTYLEKVRLLGVHSVQLEVDVPNRHVWLTHQMLGAKVVARFRTPDGRNRMILEHVLNKDEKSPVAS
jgi:ribosomal protein S18 acetylase RimI-like enzyme